MFASVVNGVVHFYWVDIQEGEVCFVPFKYVKTDDKDIDHLFLLT